MSASCLNSQKTWIIQWTFSAFYVAAVLSGIQAEKDVCPEEEIQLSSPKLESEIKSGDYEGLVWTVTDPNTKPRKVKQPLVYCPEDLSCTRYPRIGGDFETRIKIGNSTRGKLNVTLTVKNDLLTFSCYIQRKNAKAPPPHQVNVSSSVTCLSLVAGQDVILNQAMGEMPSTEIFEDIDWYWIKPDGQKQKIVSCNPTTCSFEDCNGSCPRSRPRLKIDGVNLMLMNVEEVDRGLKLECRMYPKTIGWTTTNTLKIEDVSTSDSFSSTSQSKNSKTSSQSPSQTPTRSTTAWVRGTQSSAGSQVLAFTAVFVSLVISLFEIS